MWVKVTGLLREVLIKSFDRLGMNGKHLIFLLLALPSHEQNRFIQRFLRFVYCLTTFIYHHVDSFHKTQVGSIAY